MNQRIYTRENLLGQFSAETTLEAIFKSIEHDLKPTGEVVCQFKVNGLSLDEETEKRLGSVCLVDVDFIEVNSQQPDEILNNILKTWCQRIPTIIQMNDELSDRIRKNGVEGCLKDFVDLIDDCQLLVDSIISINTLYSHVEGVRSEVWKKAEQHMADGIGQSLQAFEKKDYTLLSDVLEYDLGHALQSWFEILTSFNETIQSLRQNQGKAGSLIEHDNQNPESREKAD